MTDKATVFDQEIDRRHTDSIKWSKYADQDIIPMWVADMDFTSPPEIIEAMHRRIEHGVFGYAAPPETLIETVVDHLQRQYEWTVHRDWLVWLPGLVSGLNVACRSVGKHDTGILTNTPIYPPFLSAPKNAGKMIHTSPMVVSQGRWEIDFDDLQTDRHPSTALFILCNPHNPTGRMLTKMELLTVADICTRKDWIICSDEIHCDLILESGRRHIPIASLDADIADRTITLMAPSKTYNIPGLGCSFAVIPNDRLRRRFNHAMAGIVPHVNLIGYVAAEAAYTYGQPWLAKLLNYLQANRDYLYHAVAEMPGLSLGTVEATYLAWIDTRQTGIDAPGPFFEAAGVGLSNGVDFRGPGFVRLNFGCTRATLTKALQRMSRALQSQP